MQSKHQNLSGVKKDVRITRKKIQCCLEKKKKRLGWRQSPSLGEDTKPDQKCFHKGQGGVSRKDLRETEKEKETCWKTKKRGKIKKKVNKKEGARCAGKARKMPAFWGEKGSLLVLGKETRGGRHCLCRRVTINWATLGDVQRKKSAWGIILIETQGDAQVELLTVPRVGGFR